MINLLRQWGYFFKCIFVRFFRDGCIYRSSALTFTSLLAMVPLMLVSVSILSAFPVFKSLGETVQNFVFANFVPSAGEVVKTYLHQFVQQASQLSLVGILFLLVTAVLLLFTIEQSFNAIWRVRKHRKGVAAFMMYWAVLTLSPILIGASFDVSTYLLSLPLISDTAQHLGFGKLLLTSTPYILAVITFTILYVAIPNCYVPLRYGFIGGVVAAILFECAKYGFTAYIKFFPTYELVYGALASIPLFLLWLYVSWLIILFGAELTYGLTFHRALRTDTRLHAFAHSFRWLAYLWQAQTDGRGLSLRQLVNQDLTNYDVAPDEQMEMLLKCHLVQHTNGSKYVLCRDLSALSLRELYKILPWKLPELDDLQQDNPWDKKLAQALTPLQSNMADELGMTVVDVFQQDGGKTT